MVKIIFCLPEGSEIRAEYVGENPGEAALLLLRIIYD